MKIGFSSWNRALWELLLEEEAERIGRALETRARQIKRPSSNDAVGMADFDAELKRILRETLRTMPRRRRSDRPVAVARVADAGRSNGRNIRPAHSSL